jgi:hypothetical protein
MNAVRIVGLLCVLTAPAFAVVTIYSFQDWPDNQDRATLQISGYTSTQRDVSGDFTVSVSNVYPRVDPGDSIELTDANLSINVARSFGLYLRIDTVRIVDFDMSQPVTFVANGEANKVTGHARACYEITGVSFPQLLNMPFTIQGWSNEDLDFAMWVVSPSDEWLNYDYRVTVVGSIPIEIDVFGGTYNGSLNLDIKGERLAIPEPALCGVATLAAGACTACLRRRP